MMAKSETLKQIYFDWLFKDYDFIDLSDDIVKINT